MGDRRMWAIPSVLLAGLLLAPTPEALSRVSGSSVRMGGKRYHDLQAALDRARPGATIVLGPGLHIGKSPGQRLDGLRIRGRDGRFSGTMELRGNGISIDRLDIVGGTLTVRGDRARVRRVSVRDARLELHGRRARVRDSQFDGADETLLIAGDRAQVKGCEFGGRRVRDSDLPSGTGVRVEGDRARLQRNAFEDLAIGAELVGDRNRFTRNQSSETSTVVAAAGDGALITSNDLEVPMSLPGASTPTIRVEGADARVDGNHVARRTWSGYEIQQDVASIPVDEVEAWLAGMDVIGTGISVTGDRASVADNELQGTAIGVDVRGRGATVEANRCDTLDVAIAVSGDDARVAENTVTAAFMGIDLSGDAFDVCANDLDVGRIAWVLDGFAVRTVLIPVKDRPPVLGFVLRPTGGVVALAGCPAIAVRTDQGGGSLCDNTAAHLMGGVGYHLEVDDAVIADNVDASTEDGTISFVVVGNGNELRANTVTDAGTRGFDLSGSVNTVVANRVDGSTGDGFVIRGDANTIAENDVGTTSGLGLHVTGDLNSVDRNSVTNALDDAVRVQGSGNELVGNRIPATSDDAYVIDGSDNSLRDNQVSLAVGDGFCIASGTGNLLTACIALRCGGDGLENVGLDTSVVDSVFRQNDRDVAGSGTFQLFEENRFGSYLVD